MQTSLGVSRACRRRVQVAGGSRSIGSRTTSKYATPPPRSAPPFLDLQQASEKAEIVPSSEMDLPGDGGDESKPPPVSPYPNWAEDSDEMVGSKVRVYWDGDNEWYSGRIVRYKASQAKKYLVRCGGGGGGARTRQAGMALAHARRGGGSFVATSAGFVGFVCWFLAPANGVGSVWHRPRNETARSLRS